MSLTHTRADAQRNRERILDAARDAFADASKEVSMAEIARRAEVGMATLYRNFPSRRELLEALYADQVDALCSAAETPVGDPGATLRLWLVQLFDFFAAKRVFGAELMAVDPRSSVFGVSRARVTIAGLPLLQAAQSSGEVRAEFDIDQILDLVHAVAAIPGGSARVRPILDATLDGLRTTRR